MNNELHALLCSYCCLSALIVYDFRYVTAAQIRDWVPIDDPYKVG